jgi:hypothetical protein
MPRSRKACLCTRILSSVSEIPCLLDIAHETDHEIRHGSCSASRRLDRTYTYLPRCLLGTIQQRRNS